MLGQPQHSAAERKPEDIGRQLAKHVTREADAAVIVAHDAQHENMKIPANIQTSRLSSMDTRGAGVVLHLKVSTVILVIFFGGLQAGYVDKRYCNFGKFGNLGQGITISMLMLCAAIQYGVRRFLHHNRRNTSARGLSPTAAMYSVMYFYFGTGNTQGMWNAADVLVDAYPTDIVCSWIADAAPCGAPLIIVIAAGRDRMFGFMARRLDRNKARKKQDGAFIAGLFDCWKSRLVRPGGSTGRSQICSPQPGILDAIGCEATSYSSITLGFICLWSSDLNKLPEFQLPAAHLSRHPPWYSEKMRKRRLRLCPWTARVSLRSSPSPAARFAAWSSAKCP